MRQARWASLALLAMLVGACGSPRIGARDATTSIVTTTTNVVTTSSQPLVSSSSVAVVPVVPCPTSYGAGNGSHPFIPRQLPAAGTATGLSFYSNGLLTVLAPSGWTCGALVAADGGQLLDAYPPGSPDYSTHEPPPGATLVQLAVDYTGHGPGAALICPLFPGSPAVTFLQGAPPCAALPPAEQTIHVTNDIVAFTDPPGVKGTGAGSGGSLPSSGDAVYPRIGPSDPPGGVTVSVLSCTLTSTMTHACQAIAADFLVRQAPAYTGRG